MPHRRTGQLKTPSSSRRSPYVEPDGSLEAGFIIEVSLASLFFFVTSFYLFYKHRMHQQEHRLKQVFAKSVAKNIEGGKSKDLSPAELGNTYNKIDVDGWQRNHFQAKAARASILIRISADKFFSIRRMLRSLSVYSMLLSAVAILLLSFLAVDELLYLYAV